MKKALIIVSILAVTFIFVGAAFVGGVAVGRFALNGYDDPVTLVTTTQPDSSTPVEPSTEAPAELSSGNSTVEGLNSDDFDYEVLQDVLKLLDQQFYGELPDAETLAYGAIRGMLLTLDDPYTSFIDPEISAILNEDATGEFEGIGAMVTMREDGYLEIASLIPGQPAEKSGVLPGDVVIAVGDQSIVGLGLYEAISYIRGPAGTEAVLEIARSSEEDTIVITVVRAKIESPVVQSEMLEDDIAYILLTEFDSKADERVKLAMEDLLAQNPKALIFDLRSNPGGWLDQAIKVSDIFLDEGTVAIERDSSGEEMRFYSYDGDLGEDIPMVVLINSGSASASEIVAGALQDRNRAVLIGEISLGKGSVQRPNNLSDGSQLRVTIARWFTPNEQELHGNGLTPEIEVEFPRDTPVGEDPQLDRAIEYLLGGE